MAIQFVNVGTVPNDGTGDPLRVAFIKINDNFAEVEVSLSGNQADIDAIQVILAGKAEDADVLHKTGNETKTSGSLTLNDDLFLPNIVLDPTPTVSPVGIGTFTRRLVELPIKENLEIVVTNKTGSMIPKGSVVYINGAQGAKPTIALALADANIATSLAIGIVENDILTNAVDGRVVTNGIVERLNTSVFNEGDRVFLSSTIPGGLTTVPPTSPNNVIFVGTVIYSHSSQGRIMVSVAYTFKLDRLVDVSISAPVNNDLLTYEASSGLWKNKPILLSAINGLTFAAGSVKLGGTLTENTAIAMADKTIIWTGNSASPLFVVQNLNDVGIKGISGTNTGLYGQTSSDTIPAIVGNTTGTATSGLTPALELRRTSTLPSVDGYGQEFNFYTQAGSVLPVSNSIVSRWSSVASVTRLSEFIIRGTDTSFFKDLITLKGNGLARLNQYGVSQPSGGSSTPAFSLSVDPQGYIIHTPVPINNPIPDTRTLNINGNIYDLTANRDWRVGMGDTGVLSFQFPGLSSGSPAATTINVAPVLGYVVNNETNPGTPSFTFINYPGGTNLVVPVAGGDASFVMLEPNGSGGGIISFINHLPTSAERKAKIWLGKVGHPDSITITTVINEPDFILSPNSQLRDLFQALGPFINENVYPSANGATMGINVSAGNYYGDGINFVNDKTNPNRIVYAGGTAVSFFPRTRTGLGGAAITAVNPTVYDVAGAVTPVPGGPNVSTLQYFWAVPGQGFVMQLGQITYGNLDAAKLAVGKEANVIFPNLLGNAILIGVLAVRNGATNLGDTTHGQFFRADKLGQIGAAGGSSAVGAGPVSITISTTPAFTTSTVDTNGYGQDGRNVIVNNLAVATTITIDSVVTSTYMKQGSAAVTFTIAAPITTLVQVDGTAVLNGIPGSSASVIVSGTTAYLRVSNA